MKTKINQQTRLKTMFIVTFFLLGIVFSGSVEAQTITVTSPNIGANWEVGSSRWITWTTTGVVGSVQIEYSYDGGGTWLNIISTTPNTGGHFFTVPGPPSTNCLVRISEAADGIPTDVSDAVFTASGYVLNSPNGGESLEAGDSFNITWNTIGVSGDVRIEYSIDNGSTWKSIAASTPDVGTYSWTVPNDASSTCLVRVAKATDGFPRDESDGVFSISGLTVTSPNGGENWDPGSSQDITWTSTGTIGDVAIDYSVDNGMSWKSVVANTANDGTYSWTVPDDPSSASLVRVSEAADGSPSDVSDGVFSIPGLTVTAPNGAETWDPGSSQNITWTSIGTVGDVMIEYSVDNGSSWKSIVPSTANTGTYSWTVPDDPSSAGLVRVSEAADGSPSDVSDAPFTIYTPPAGPGHFTFTSNSDDNYSLVIDNATLDGNALGIGDEIGVFTPAGLCVGASVWDGNTPFALVAWADNSQTVEVDGYTSGETMFFRIWDLSAGTNNDYLATPTYSMGNDNFGNGAYGRISLLEALTPSGTLTQVNSLSQGWNWVSFNVEPSDLTVYNFFSGATHLVIAVNNAGQFYIPNVINYIGQMNVLEGYKAYVSAPDQVRVTGNPVLATTPINLITGWQFISYLPSTPIPAETALASILSELVVVKNDDGGFFIPNVVNTLGNMAAGEGYKVYVNSNTTLTYPQSSTLAKQTVNEPVPTNMKTRNFTFTAHTGDNYSMVVTHSILDGSRLEIGDEIGVYTPGGLCVGASIWTGTVPLALTTWIDNSQTPLVDGYVPGEAMIFKIWKQGFDAEFPVAPSYSQGDGTFGSGAFGSVSLLAKATSEEDIKGRIPKSFFLSRNYPNPFNPSTHIRFALPTECFVTLKVYDMLGKEMDTIISEHRAAGEYEITWNAGDFPSGIYFYRLEAGGFAETRKLILQK